MIKKLFLAFTLVFAFTITACSNTVKYPKTYGDVTVTEAKKTDAGVVMTLKADGFRKEMKLVVEVTVKEGKITAYTVKSHEESKGYGKTMIEAGLIQQAFIEQSASLSSMDLTTFYDSEATATITANAMLDIAKAALKHFDEDYK